MPGGRASEATTITKTFAAEALHRVVDRAVTSQYPAGYLDAQMARVPVGRKRDPRELAAALVFLASDASGYVTGQTLAVDGGMTIA